MEAKPETVTPYPVGLLVMADAGKGRWYAAQIVGEYGQRTVDFGDVLWCYEVDVFHVPPPNGRPWCIEHRYLRPITPLDADAQPREVDAPVDDEVMA